MPSGRTHDIITYALAPPTFIGAQLYWGDWLISVVATAAMVFAGLMFGPDLDLHSKQYKRWGPLRFIWFPYMYSISHRSRLSHGLLLSTVFRILYFIAVFAVLASVVLYARHRYLYGEHTTWGAEFERVSLDLGAFWNRTDKQYFRAAFAGLWLGAAAHTVSDVTWSVVKKVWKVV
ncbi:MAG TPA: metal-binding protein [Blastocatellia bacterium]|nr:metal-binding protein [Blastocatellia bacterium]